MGQRIEIIEKCTETRFRDSYRFIVLSLYGDAKAGYKTMYIDAKEFKEILKHRGDWVQSKKTVNGVEIPYVFRMNED